jgi:hypothetical protein
LVFSTNSTLAQEVNSASPNQAKSLSIIDTASKKRSVASKAALLLYRLVYTVITENGTT